MVERVRRRRRRAARRAPGTSGGIRGAVLALLLALTAACAPSPGSAASGTNPLDDDDGRPMVLATFTVLADIAREVAGDRVRVESITKVGAEIHGYEPTPGDLRRAAGAQLILDNGLGLEAWFEQFVASLDVPHVVVSEGLEPIAITSDAAVGTDNPHAWMSPAGGTHYAQQIAAALTELDPAGAREFEANAAALSKELDVLHTELRAAVDSLPPERRVLVTCEGAFSYLARDAGLEEAFIWPVNAEQQATPRRVAAVIDLVREREVPAVFCESTVSAEPMQRVAEATDAELGGTLYVDSLSEPDGPVPSYLELLRHDIDVIVAGLSGGAS